MCLRHPSAGAELALTTIGLEGCRQAGSCSVASTASAVSTVVWGHTACRLAVGHHGKQRIRQVASSRCLTSGTVVSMRLRVFGLIVAAALAGVVAGAGGGSPTCNMMPKIDFWCALDGPSGAPASA